MTARLVPGATTVTTGARYSSLHGYVAHERNLSDSASLEVLRRWEIVVAAASEVHPSPGLPASHGAGVVGNWLRRDGHLDMVGLSTPKSGYANPERGFLGPYLGSEITMGILEGQLVTGDRYDHQSVRSGFDGLLDLAAQPIISLADLDGTANLAVGAAATEPDGRWLARLLTGSGSGEPSRSDDVRRNTIRTLVRAMALSGSSSPVDAVRDSAGRLTPILSWRRFLKSNRGAAFSIAMTPWEPGVACGRRWLMR